VVSVITRGESDDANFATLASETANNFATLASETANNGATLASETAKRTVWLRISRTEPSYALHASTDGSRWQFVRHFRLGELPGATIQIGLSVQSPTGEGCTARFEEIRFGPTRLAELRDGS
jgi:regulation of enolase protein 1 (concanavalin A-like superfamily)